jgi:hypothetical protein
MLPKRISRNLCPAMLLSIPFPSFFFLGYPDMIELLPSTFQSFSPTSVYGRETQTQDRGSSCLIDI